MKFEIGEIVKFVQLDGVMIVKEHLGIIVQMSGTSIKVEWFDGGYGWMHERWLQKAD